MLLGQRVVLTSRGNGIPLPENTATPKTPLQCGFSIPKRSDLFQEKLVIWVRNHCYDQRNNEQPMVFRHPYPHLAGLASLFSTSCACRLTTLLLASCSPSRTGMSH